MYMYVETEADAHCSLMRVLWYYCASSEILQGNKLMLYCLKLGTVYMYVSKTTVNLLEIQNNIMYTRLITAHLILNVR